MSQGIAPGHFIILIYYCLVLLPGFTGYHHVDHLGRHRPPTNHPIEGGGATKLKRRQVLVSKLFIYTLIGCSCFTVSMITINKIK